MLIRIIAPSGVRVARLEKREYQRYGKRILPGGDMYKDHIEFIKWAKAYDFGDLGMRSKALHNEWLKKISCQKLTVDGTKPVYENIEYIKKNFEI